MNGLNERKIKNKYFNLIQTDNKSRDLYTKNRNKQVNKQFEPPQINEFKFDKRER